MAKNDSVASILETLEKALSSVQKRTKDLNVSLVRAKVSLKVASKHDTGSKLDLGAWVPVTLGADYTTKTIQSMTFTLVPAGGHLDLGGELDESELADSIIGLASEIGKINSTVFNLDEANLSLEFAVSTDGGIKVIGLGHTRESADTHGLDLWFRRTP
jgi:hypothetical protein